MKALAILGLLSLAATTPAQQVLWQLGPAADIQYRAVWPFVDYDRDGYVDVVVTGTWFAPLGTDHGSVRICSGRDGATLYEHRRRFSDFHPLCNAGDLDGDGNADLVFTDNVLRYWNIVEAWSPALDSSLWSVVGPGISGGFGRVLAGDLDTDGDGQPNVLIGSNHPSNSDLFVYDHKGELRYQIPLAQRGLLLQSVAAVGDLDGDGADDYVIGCLESTGAGVVHLVSGRTGTFLRSTLGQQPYDGLGNPVIGIGDWNGDGVRDYAAGSERAFGRGNMAVISGADASYLAFWTSMIGNIGASLLGGFDIDRDGTTDLLAGSYGYPNGSFYGRLQALSGRDHRLLWEDINTTSPGTSYFAQKLADLGVQPGSPYRVLASADAEWYEFNMRPGRIRALRTNLRGTGAVIGDGCSSAAPAAPSIGFRMQGNRARIVLGGAPPGAFAWLSIASAGTSVFGGIALPHALDPYGLTGCTLQVPPETWAVATVGSAPPDVGYAHFDLPVALATGTGRAMAAQWLALDPANLSFAASPRHEFRVR